MPPRTKACAICRKKRIKCDATLPQCLMCIRTNRECPGLMEGPLIIDMTAFAGAGMKKKKKKSEISTNHPYKTLPEDLMMRLVPQISQQAIMNEAFYANFLLYFTSDGEGKDLQNKMTWLHRLPQLSSDGSNRALSLAVQATAFAYCGVELANMPILQNAAKLYGQALNTHARLLQSKPKLVTIHMISTSVMLSLFEAMQATTASAYREHINGAAKMFEVTSPGQCLDGVLCQLFFHIRTQMVFVYLTTPPTQMSQMISAEKILVETLSYRRLPRFQRLISHIATLAELYVYKTSPDSKQQLIDLSVYSSVKAEVDGLWLEYEEEAEQQNESLFWEVDGHTEYRDCFTALSIAYFSSARVLFTILAPRLAVTFPDFTDHYSAILKCASFLQIRKIGCSYMRMATPLYLVALHSPSSRQRQQAISAFKSWNTSGMAGISALALETMRRHQNNKLPDDIVPEERPKFNTIQHVPLDPPVSMPNKACPLDIFEFEGWIGQT